MLQRMSVSVTEAEGSVTRLSVNVTRMRAGKAIECTKAVHAPILQAGACETLLEVQTRTGEDT